MPRGKPAGVVCIHLDHERRCRIWGTADYPEVCRRFTPRPDVCGDRNEEAFMLIANLELEDAPSRISATSKRLLPPACLP